MEKKKWKRPLTASRKKKGSQKKVKLDRRSPKKSANIAGSGKEDVSRHGVPEVTMLLRVWEGDAAFSKRKFKVEPLSRQWVEHASKRNRKKNALQDQEI